jgi:lipoprotein-anchoring transpeptidase ErfK/SrfK
MIERKPELARYGKDCMKPGLSNPLGARALYLFNEDGEDTLFRLHGTPEWNSIGTAASSGCIRLMNQDIIDLYDRVRPGRGAKVVVKQ